MSNPQTQTQAVQKANTLEKPLEFKPFGATETITLTINITKKLLAVPTKTGKTCSDRDAMKFMMMCQAKGLNPFEGDAFLVGYDEYKNGAPTGFATFTQITAHQAFLKRAELHKEFDGFESGICLMLEDENGAVQVIDREGDFHLPEERVVGGWCRVHFKNRKIPVYRRLRLARFNTGRSIWKDDPAGMIVKCAEADALRSAFPTKMGGLYTREEMASSIPIEATVTSEMENVPLVGPGGEPEPETPAAEAEQKATPQQSPKGEAEKKGAKVSPKKELENAVLSEKLSFGDFQKWAVVTENIPGADSMAGFADVPEEIAKRLNRNVQGLIEGIRRVKEGADA